MLKLTIDSPKEDYAEVYSNGVGYVFKYEDNYETIYSRVQKYAPPGVTIGIIPIVPGTEYFENYGMNSILVYSLIAPL